MRVLLTIILFTSFNFVFGQEGDFSLHILNCSKSDSVTFKSGSILINPNNYRECKYYFGHVSEGRYSLQLHRSNELLFLKELEIKNYHSYNLTYNYQVNHFSEHVTKNDSIFYETPKRSESKSVIVIACGGIANKQDTKKSKNKASNDEPLKGIPAQKNGDFKNKNPSRDF